MKSSPTANGIVSGVTIKSEKKYLDRIFFSFFFWNGKLELVSKNKTYSELVTCGILVFLVSGGGAIFDFGAGSTQGLAIMMNHNV